jgi:hypothetical protein
MNIVFYMYVAYKLEIGLQHDLESVIRLEGDNEVLLISVFLRIDTFTFHILSRMFQRHVLFK